MINYHINDYESPAEMCTFENVCADQHTKYNSIALANIMEEMVAEARRDRNPERNKERVT